MRTTDQLTRQFEAHRGHLRAVAYRMLGSLGEAEDAVQEAWLRFDRTDTSDVENIGGWLTTVVSRIALDMLRSRSLRPEEFLDTHVPDPIVILPGTGGVGAGDPEREAMVTDDVGIALDVVLETLSPPERVAFVLHDMFGVPFDAVAEIVGRTSDATRKLASRARQRVQGAAPVPDKDVGRQRQAVDAFFAAAREGDFDALVAVLDPDVVLRSDAGVGRRATQLVRGASTVAGQALTSRPRGTVHPVLVNGAAGVVVLVEGRVVTISAFTVVDATIVRIDVLQDLDRLAALPLPPGLRPR